MNSELGYTMAYNVWSSLEIVNLTRGYVPLTILIVATTLLIHFICV